MCQCLYWASRWYDAPKSWQSIEVVSARGKADLIVHLPPRRGHWGPDGEVEGIWLVGQLDLHSNPPSQLILSISCPLSGGRVHAVP